MDALDGKTAIVYGAGGPVGSAVASAMAAEGATLHLASRTLERLRPVADRIRDAGGSAHVATVDVLDQQAVADHARSVAGQGRIDICFNAVANDDIQGTALGEMVLADFLQPVTKALSSHFTIGTTVGRHMADQGGGVILCMAGGREAIPRLGGSHVAWAALSGLCRQLAADFGPRGVRVVWLLSPGSVVSVDDSGDDAGAETDDQPDQPDEGSTEGLLKGHQPTYDEVGRIAAYLSSDAARTITAAEINLTGGAVID
jgi:3-oxoacyl-[acyl-carrier protein] reductase